VDIVSMREQANQENQVPYFSIILPCKNSIHTIERTIKSVLSQSVSFELIIVDGASTDGTLELIQLYLADARVRLDSQSDTGIYAAINRGIGLARGRYIGVLNSDDAYLEGALESVQLLLNVEAHFIACSCLWVNIKTGTKIQVDPIKLEDWTSLGLQQMPTPHVGLFIERKIYAFIGNYNLSYKIASDHEFVLRLSRAQIRGIYNPIPIAIINSGGVSGGIRAKEESRRIAVRHGRSIILSFIVLFIQVMKLAIVLLLPNYMLSILLRKRFRVKD